MTGCFQTRVRKQPIFSLYFDSGRRLYAGWVGEMRVKLEGTRVLHHKTRKISTVKPV